ncbi:hypothetical protein ABAC460_03400 [Asticcacaulis sp. AC460]|uniref:hypothetical protein n=1 Tax=Asticcacaulis sp. AC460 TaxID=1282360 RepID=UPI0003C404C1|nr:hypothetical protein [Asticcacaulis sp. AC460]ESQ91957.1 hypothetical protein ABAC460_03400 [Asticcacaulis sp. AC460]
MIIGDRLRAMAAVGFMALGFCACSQDGSHAQGVEPGAAAQSWTIVPTGPDAKVVQATRTVALQGGGELDLRLSCDFRPSSDPIMNGYWLKLEGSFKGADGTQLGIGDSALRDGLAMFVVVRSTGEAGQMGAEATTPDHFTYDNNQTNELNQDNNDPAKVEIANSIDIPLSDGRIISVMMQKEDAGYTGLISQCAGLGPKTGDKL